MSADEPNPGAINDYFAANEGVTGVEGQNITFGTGDTTTASEVAEAINADVATGLSIHGTETVTAGEVAEAAQEASEWN
jgi:hypothetical protein